MCSTPQKHPAATVAVAEPSGDAIEDSLGLKERRVLDVKGRVMRDMNEGIVKAMRRASIEMRRIEARD
jgi:hypothetical protein